MDDAWAYDTDVYNGIEDLHGIIAVQPLHHAMAKGLQERPDHLMAWWLVHSGNLERARNNWAGHAIPAHAGPHRMEVLSSHGIERTRR